MENLLFCYHFKIINWEYCTLNTSIIFHKLWHWLPIIYFLAQSFLITWFPNLWHFLISYWWCFCCIMHYLWTITGYSLTLLKNKINSDANNIYTCLTSFYWICPSTDPNRCQTLTARTHSRCQFQQHFMCVFCMKVFFCSFF